MGTNAIEWNGTILAIWINIVALDHFGIVFTQRRWHPFATLIKSKHLQRPFQKVTPHHGPKAVGTPGPWHKGQNAQSHPDQTSQNKLKPRLISVL